MVQPERKLGEFFSYRDLLTWPEEERWELIDGVAYDMTPAPGTTHQGIVLNLARQFADFLDGKPCRVFVAPLDVLLPEGDEADEDVTTVVQPDLLVVCDRSKITERFIKGAPELVVEILSPATSKKDLNEKLRRYQRAGVREYWVIHPSGQTLTVFRMGDDGRFALPETFVHGDTVAVQWLDGLTIELQRIFAGEA